jgi:hypothetical protein
MLKSGFYYAINLSKYWSLTDGTSDLWSVVDKLVSLDDTSGTSSWSTLKWTEELGTLLPNDAIQLYFDAIFFLDI